MKNKIHFLHGRCEDIMDRMIKSNFKVDLILTSPPYNTGRPSNSENSRDNYEGKYDIHLDTMTAKQYRSWCVELFNKFDNILNKNGTILWQTSYGTDATVNKECIGLLWGALSDIIDKTNFTIADRIVWKKSSALPNNASPNKLTRITEDVYVFCRKNEFMTFNSNKQVKSVSKKGQSFYENIFNFIEAKNNDGKNKLNKATYSTELCEKLLSIYAKNNCVVYDPFMGTGTTGIACANMGLECYGSEISQAQVEYSIKRLQEREVNNEL